MIVFLNNMIRQEIAQLSKLFLGQDADDESIRCLPADDVSELEKSKKSKFREGLLRLENVRLKLKEEHSVEMHAAQSKIRQLELELNEVKSENKHLLWEPRKARDGLVLLMISLTAAFSIVVVAIFMMSERQVALARAWEDKFQAYILGALGCLLVWGTVPLTHLSGQYLYGEIGFRFYQPMEGGRTFVILQGFGWGLYAVFLAIVLHIISISGKYPLNGIVTTGGVLGILGQTLMVCSLLSFRPSKSLSESNAASGTNGWVFLNGKKNPENLRSASPRLDTDTALFASFTLLMSSLVFVSLALGFIADRAYINQIHRRVCGSLAVFLLIFSALLTHFLGGSLYHRSNWNILMPVAVQTRMFLMQLMVWALFILCVASQVSVLGIPFYLSSRIMAGTSLPMTTSGIIAIACHSVIAVSIRSFRVSELEHVIKKADQGLDARLVRVGAEFRMEQVTDAKFLDEIDVRMKRYRGIRRLLGTPLIACFCNTQYVLFMIICAFHYGSYSTFCWVFANRSTFCSATPDQMWNIMVHMAICICSFTFGHTILKMFVEHPTARITGLISLNVVPIAWMFHSSRSSPVLPIAQLYAFMFVLYNWITFSGRPEITGCREWKGFRKYDKLWALFDDYHGGKVIVDEKLQELEKRDGATLGSVNSSCKQAICGYAPHGIFPTAAVWLPNSPSFTSRFPGFSITSCAASIILHVPLMRDLVEWSGGREVGRESVSNALNNGRSPLLVVGGQKEMFLSKSWTNEIALHRRHKGFIRLAIQHNVPIVPIFNFGEQKVMDNLYFPKMQAWFKTYFGFPVPYFPYGRWFLPVPRRVPMTFCIGAPIYPVKRSENPTEEEVYEFHSRYFDYVAEMFERNKARAGYPDARIVWNWN